MANNILWPQPQRNTVYLYPYMSVPLSLRRHWAYLPGKPYPMDRRRGPVSLERRSVVQHIPEVFQDQEGFWFPPTLSSDLCFLWALALAVLWAIRKHTPVFLWVMSLTGRLSVPEWSLAWSLVSLNAERFHGFASRNPPQLLEGSLLYYACTTVCQRFDTMLD